MFVSCNKNYQICLDDEHVNSYKDYLDSIAWKK